MLPHTKITLVDGHSIIAIHGLGGDAYRTWTHENEKLWLRDFLPLQIPKARVLTYGYNSVVAFSKSSSKVDEFSRDLLFRAKSIRTTTQERNRPIFFICHSLGGIVFKQALNFAHQDARNYRELLERFMGVAFMGTPHGGSDFAFWMSYAAGLVHVMSLGTRTNRDLVTVLRRNSEFLGALSERFKFQNEQLGIITFYETEKFSLLNAPIVDKDSAILKLPNEIVLPIYSNHRDMCRFADSTDQKYLPVGQALAALVHNQVQAGKKAPLGFYSKVLVNGLSPRPRFKTGYRPIISTLSGCKGLQAVIVQTLVWQLLQEKSHMVDDVFAIYAETAGAVAPTVSFERALSVLVSNGKQCLLIIDGLDESPNIDRAALKQLIPRLEKTAKILLASRQESWIVSMLPGGRFRSLIIRPCDNDSDIERFVDQKVQDSEWDQHTKSTVATFIKTGANGMFLWVELMLRHISQQTTPNEITMALSQMPEGLPGVYRRLLKQITRQSPARREFARRILQWTFSAVRQLSLEELRAAVANIPGSNVQNYGDFVPDFKGMITATCGPLVEIDETKGLVRFVHASAVEFFREEAMHLSIKNNLDAIQIVCDVRNAYTASVCLTCLAYDNFDYVPAHSNLRNYDTHLASHLEKHAFLEYCALHWWRHVPPDDETHMYSQDSLLVSAMIRFRTSQKAIIKWIQLFMLLDGPQKEKADPLNAFLPSCLHFGASISAEPMPQKGYPRIFASPSFLFNPWDRWLTETFFNGRHASPVGIASFFDFDDLVLSELNKGLDINTRDPGGFTPLLYASHGEAIDTVRLLLAKGADPNLVTDFGYGAARYASRNCIAVLPQLLHSGAPLGIFDQDDGMTPIHTACLSTGWHRNVLIELLLYCKFEDLDAADNSGMTPLHHAASIDIRKSVDLLMSRLSGLNKPLSGDKAFHLVSAQEAFTPASLEAINLWLSSWFAHTIQADEIDTNVAKVRKQIATAVRRIKEEMIELLLAQKPSANKCDVLGQTPLHSLARSTSKDEATDIENLNQKDVSIQTLIDFGFSAIQRDLSNQNILEIALARHNFRIAKTLLTSGVSTATAGTISGAHLNVVLHETPMEQNHFETSTMLISEGKYHPTSSFDVLQVTILLRRLLSVGSCYGRSDEEMFRHIISSIITYAKYWTRKISEHNPTSFNRNSIVAEIIVGPWPIRKIEIFVGRQRRHIFSSLYLSSDNPYSSHPPRRRLPQSGYFGYNNQEDEDFEWNMRPCGSMAGSDEQDRVHLRGGTGKSWPITGRHFISYLFRQEHSSQKVRETYEGKRQPSSPFQTDDALLQLVRYPKQKSQSYQPYGLSQSKTSQVHLVSAGVQLWQSVDISRRSGVEAWKQVWPLQVDNRSHGNTDFESCNMPFGSGSIDKWMDTLVEGDRLCLMLSEGAFVQDVALFSQFGLVIYTSLL